MQRTRFSSFLFATFLIFMGSLFFFSPCYGMEEEDNQRPLPHMKFRLGFEFQEGSSLRPWALENNNVQKKKFFKFKDHDTQKNYGMLLLIQVILSLLQGLFLIKNKVL
ncbi:MAG: hypothetical protein K2P93_06780 [Alphaproteobacteria bacterium]|nr:hypothetical protein [Alphaproteobacteria bacterium]